jgi:hypothetical protein
MVTSSTNGTFYEAELRFGQSEHGWRQSTLLTFKSALRRRGKVSAVYAKESSSSGSSAVEMDRANRMEEAEL